MIKFIKKQIALYRYEQAIKKAGRSTGLSAQERAKLKDFGF